MQALELCPGSAECYLERAKLHEATGAGNKAVEDFKVQNKIIVQNN